MTLLTLIRHGQTDWNLHRRIQGSSDIPLNATGEEQARAAAALLAVDEHHAVYASPLLRAHRTAEIIAEELALTPPVRVPGLQERSYGEAEGMQDTEYLARFGHWHADVPGAELREAVRDRAIAALERIAIAARHRSAPASESLVVVTHGGVIRALLDHASGGTLPLEGAQVLNGSAHRFVLEPGLLRLRESELSAAAH